jgi:hypothetical protein
MISEIKAGLGIKDKNKEGIAVKSDGFFLTLEAQKGSQIKTLEQLLEVSNVDLGEYEVDHFISNVWNSFSGVAGLVDLWQVKAWMKKRQVTPTKIAEIVKLGLKDCTKPKQKTKTNKKKSGTMIEFGIPDLHIGKLCWPEETTQPAWGMRITEATFKEALEDLIDRSPKDAEEAWFVLGNDFFNVDNAAYGTAAGTLQDEDGRWQKTYRDGRSLAIWAIERLREQYPMVRVPVIYGNHDPERTFYLGELLDQMYAGYKDIQIDNRACHRKYMRWGDTLIGLTHGDRIKSLDLTHLAQNEARKLWGETNKCEFHLGHYHHESVKELGGVKLRILPSLCPADAWHSRSGYTTAERAAQAFVYEKKGLSNIIYHYPDIR